MKMLLDLDTMKTNMTIASNSLQVYKCFNKLIFFKLSA